jgi:hypothetical protein
MENLKDLNLLISETELAKALGLPKSSMYRLRLDGCPWVSISRKPYYHATLFMEWVLRKKLRKAEERSETVDN